MRTLDRINKYLEFAEKRQNRRPLTLRTYKRTLVAFDAWLIERDLALETIGPDDVEDFGWRTTARGLNPSPATARKEMTAVVQFLKWAAARQGLNTNAHLAVVTPTLPARQPNPISDDLWRRIWRADLPIDDRLWLGDAYFLGRRRMEIVTTPPEAVDAERKQLRFFRKGGKEAILEYASLCEIQANELPWLFEGWEVWVATLEEHADRRQGEKHLSVFATADDPFLDGNRLTRRLFSICAKIGVERIGPHRLRHSTATNLFRAGVPAEVVREVMGHESFNTTTTYQSVAGYLSHELERTRQ